jgi:hypothetical protein
MLRESHGLNLVFDELFPQVMRYILHNTVEGKMLFNCHPFEDRVILRAIPDQSPHFLKIGLAVQTVYCQHTASWCAFIGQTLEGS